jgi:3-oxoacyl-ACP reductase-like protein
MSVFSKIMSAIFGSHASASPSPSSPSSSAAPSAPKSQTAQAPAAAPASTAAKPSSPSATPVDVAAVLTKLAAQNKEKLDWRHSIVDLMKLLKLDSSLAARKELADELHYSGDKNDSAAMNIWLHKQVMQKLADNGGKVPDELRK